MDGSFRGEGGGDGVLEVCILERELETGWERRRDGFPKCE